MVIEPIFCGANYQFALSPFVTLFTEKFTEGACGSITQQIP